MFRNIRNICYFCKHNLSKPRPLVSISQRGRLAWQAVWVASACAQTSREPAKGIEKWLAARSSRTLAKKKR